MNICKILKGSFLFSLIITFLIILNCGAANKSPSNIGAVRFICNVKDATLTIDEKDYGDIGLYLKNYIYLKPGIHRVVISHPDYFTEYFEIKVIKNMKIKIKVNLRRKP